MRARESVNGHRCGSRPPGALAVSCQGLAFHDHDHVAQGPGWTWRWPLTHAQRKDRKRRGRDVSRGDDRTPNTLVVPETS